ncbi:MAG: hypothetical protein LIP05_15970 [Tannerellaceae bacterium]|nr:hypothetical protein [Tannerellaceae bacterium]
MSTYTIPENKSWNEFFGRIILCLVGLIVWSCHSEEDIIEEPDNIDTEIMIYYLDGNEKHIISSNDTLTLSLASTLTVYIDSIDDSKLYAQSPVEVLKKDIYSYDCYARQAALAGVMFFWNNETAWKMFYINVLPIYIQYYIVETTCIIDVENESLKNMIETALLNSLLLQYSEIQLSYYTLESGDIILKNQTKKETIYGSFIEDNSSFCMLYNEEEYFFSVHYTGEGIEQYVITWDLTPIYQTQYPSEVMNEILLVSSVLKYEY